MVASTSFRSSVPAMLAQRVQKQVGHYVVDQDHKSAGTGHLGRLTLRARKGPYKQHKVFRSRSVWKYIQATVVHKFATTICDAEHDLEQHTEQIHYTCDAGSKGASIPVLLDHPTEVPTSGKGPIGRQD